MPDQFKVKVTRDTYVRGEFVKAGQEIEVDRETAAQLRARIEWPPEKDRPDTNPGRIQSRDPEAEHRDPSRRK